MTKSISRFSPFLFLLLFIQLGFLDTIPFHTLEKLRGKLVSILLVCPLARLYIREMNAHLAEAEKQLRASIKGSVELGVELHHWRNNKHMLDHENDMHRHEEIDIIPVKGKISAEYMTGMYYCTYCLSPKRTAPQILFIFLDACDYALGTYDCQTAATIRRQFSLEESSEMDIGMKEMLALKMLIQNLKIPKTGSVIRLHCDNMRCVYAYEQYGCRSQYLNDIVKYLFDWQLKHRVRLEIVYVSTHDNLADAPSRLIDVEDELCISPPVLKIIEKKFRICFSLDCCASTGTQITKVCGSKLKFCSRYVEDQSSYINFMNLPFGDLLMEVLWIFCPQKVEARFINHFLRQSRRPRACILLVQHAEQPPLSTLLREHCQDFVLIRGRNLLKKPQKKRESFIPYRGHLTLHIFYFNCVPNIF